jgi:hypothetical protein
MSALLALVQGNKDRGVEKRGASSAIETHPSFQFHSLNL